MPNELEVPNFYESKAGLPSISSLPFELAKIVRALDLFNGPIPLDQLKRILNSSEIGTKEGFAHVRFDPKSYCRTLVAKNDFYDLLIIGWLTNQQSQIHDHHGSFCAVRVISGLASEAQYLRVPDPMSANGSKFSPAAVISYQPSEVFGSYNDDLHVLGNAKSDPLVTVHIYSPPLSEMRLYGEGIPLRDQVDCDFGSTTSSSSASLCE